LAILKEAANNPKIQVGYRSQGDQHVQTILDTVGRNKLGIALLKPYQKN
jgi:endothelin-converting enzyme/putative endopeptidase